MNRLLFKTIAILVFTALMLPGCQKNSYTMNDIYTQNGSGTANAAEILEKVSGMKIYFGHRSVGNNIIGGIEQWDQEGEPLHDPEALEAFVDEMRQAVRPPAELHEIDGHINGEEFISTALSIFDRWVADGHIVPGKPEETAR